MRNYKKLLSRVALAVAFLTGLSFFIPGHPQAKAQDKSFNNIAPPDEKGPYNVGIRTFTSVPVSGGVTTIQVFYPTLDPILDPAHCQTEFKYTISYTIPGGTTGTYQRTSPLCAIQDATPPPGPFPLIIHDHGGGAGADNQRISQLPVHETLASHGFVVVAIRHSANAVARVRDIPYVINFMLGHSTTPGDPLFGRIDPDRIGLSGFSTGGGATLGVTGGWVSQGIAADPRIKAMVLYEPQRDNSLDDVATISIPYLIMGGTRHVNGVVVVPEVFNTTVLATPRLYVKNPEAVHFNNFTDLCQSIEETREASLLAEPSQAEPLTNMITVMAPSPPNPPNTCATIPGTDICRRICDPAMGHAAHQACTFWNQGEITRASLGPIAFGFGGGRNVCNLVGTAKNSNRSLDVNPVDGFTDDFVPGTNIRLFEPNDAFDYLGNNPEGDPAPNPGEIMVPIIKLYTVAFFKKFLEGDGRYMRYLTPGYANTQNLEAVVEIRE